MEDVWKREDGDITLREPSCAQSGRHGHRSLAYDAPFVLITTWFSGRTVPHIGL